MPLSIWLESKPGQTERCVFVTPLGSRVKVDVLDQCQPMHLDCLVVRDCHPGVHLGEPGVRVHEEVLSIVNKYIAKVFETNLQHSIMWRLHIMVWLQGKTDSNHSRLRLKIMLQTFTKKKLILRHPDAYMRKTRYISSIYAGDISPPIFWIFRQI